MVTASLIVRRARNRGISMAELMLVLVIAALLAIFFVYSSRSLVIRTKVSRVHEEHRQLARALQNHQLDYARLPGNLQELTGPGRYMEDLPIDPFQKGDAGYALLQVPGLDSRAVLISPGPDGRYDVPEQLMPYLATSGGHEATQTSAHHRSASGNRNAMLDASPEELHDLELIFEHYIRSLQYDPAEGPGGDLITLLQF